MNVSRLKIQGFIKSGIIKLSCCKIKKWLMPGNDFLPETGREIKKRPSVSVVPGR